MVIWIADEASNLGVRVQIPSGPLSFFRGGCMRSAFALLAALSLANAVFLIGEGFVGEETPILCENQESVFVSFPSGTTARLALDSDFQATFIPEAPGPHAVQCGTETKEFNVAASAQAADSQAANGVPQADSLVLFGIILMLILFASAAAIVAKLFFLDRTLFVKSVSGGTARLTLRAGKRLRGIRIEDPVSMGFAGKPLIFSLPSLEPGSEWSYEYEIELPERALPAGLEADLGGKEVSFLAELYIEKRKSAPPHSMDGTGRGRQKRKVQRAA